MAAVDVSSLLVPIAQGITTHVLLATSSPRFFAKAGQDISLHPYAKLPPLIEILVGTLISFPKLLALSLP